MSSAEEVDSALDSPPEIVDDVSPFASTGLSSNPYDDIDPAKEVDSGDESKDYDKKYKGSDDDAPLKSKKIGNLEARKTKKLEDMTSYAFGGLDGHIARAMEKSVDDNEPITYYMPPKSAARRVTPIKSQSALLKDKPSNKGYRQVYDDKYVVFPLLPEVDDPTRPGEKISMSSVHFVQMLDVLWANSNLMSAGAKASSLIGSQFIDFVLDSIKAIYHDLQINLCSTAKHINDPFGLDRLDKSSISMFYFFFLLKRLYIFVRSFPNQVKYEHAKMLILQQVEQRMMADLPVEKVLVIEPNESCPANRPKFQNWVLDINGEEIQISDVLRNFTKISRQNRNGVAFSVCSLPDNASPEDIVPREYLPAIYHAFNLTNFKFLKPEMMKSLIERMYDVNSSEFKNIPVADGNNDVYEMSLKKLNLMPSTEENAKIIANAYKVDNSRQSLREWLFAQPIQDWPSLFPLVHFLLKLEAPKNHYDISRPIDLTPVICEYAKGNVPVRRCLSMDAPFETFRLMALAYAFKASPAATVRGVTCYETFRSSIKAALKIISPDLAISDKEDSVLNHAINKLFVGDAKNVQDLKNVTVCPDILQRMLYSASSAAAAPEAGPAASEIVSFETFWSQDKDPNNVDLILAALLNSRVGPL